MIIDKKIEIGDPEKLPFPFFFYRRVQLNRQIENVFFYLDYGFNYTLQRIKALYPDTGAPSFKSSPDLSISLSRVGSSTDLQNRPSNIDLLSTPSEVRFENPPNQTLAGQPKYDKKIDQFYNYSEPIRIDITGQDGTNPAFCDLLLIGVYSPAGSPVL